MSPESVRDHISTTGLWGKEGMMEGRETGREGKREKGKEREEKGGTEVGGKAEGRKQQLTKVDGA